MRHSLGMGSVSVVSGVYEQSVNIPLQQPEESHVVCKRTQCLSLSASLRVQLVITVLTAGKGNEGIKISDVSPKILLTICTANQN